MSELARKGVLYRRFYWLESPDKVYATCGYVLETAEQREKTIASLKARYIASRGEEEFKKTRIVVI